MSTHNHYCAFEITDKGFDLRQTAIAGGDSENRANSHGKYKIDFTRGAIGQGRPEPDTDIYYMTELVSHAADVPIKESYAQNKNHIMAIVIDGMAFDEDITMTEIGIFARLIDADTGIEVIPEILYGYTYTNKFDYIPVGEDYNLFREIAFNTVLSRKGQFEIVYDKTKVYVTHKEVEDMISSLAAKKVRYDNSESGLDNDNMQGAINSLKKLHDETMRNIEYEPIPDEIPDGSGTTQDRFNGIGFLDALLNRITGVIISITGKAKWWQKPAMNIEEISTQLNQIATRYGVCSTSAATVAKTVSLSGFTLNVGANVTVKFTVTNTAANPTLNVNSTGAKSVFYKGAAVPTGLLVANSIYNCVYDGTYWQLTGVEIGTAINSTPEKTTLADADTVPLTDSAASNTAKKVTWLNIKNAIKSFIYGIYHGYVTCSTAAGTTVKIVALPGFSLEVGASVKIKFTNINTAANPTLNVNNTGAIPIYYKGIAIPPDILSANVVYEFVYNGTQYDLIGIPDVYTKTEIDTQLNNKVNTPIEIPGIEAIDLNNYTTPGMYFRRSGTQSFVINGPADHLQTFALFVEKTGRSDSSGNGEDGTIQTFKGFSGAVHTRVYRCYSDHNSWSKWIRIATAEPSTLNTLILNTNYQGTAVYGKNQFDMVYIRLVLTKKDGTVFDPGTGVLTLATLPAGFWPLGNGGSTVAAMLGTGGTMTTASALVEVTGTGDIRLKCSGDKSSAYTLMCSIDYPAQ